MGEVVKDDLVFRWGAEMGDVRGHGTAATEGDFSPGWSTWGVELLPGTVAAPLRGGSCVSRWMGE